MYTLSNKFSERLQYYSDKSYINLLIIICFTCVTLIVSYNYKNTMQSKVALNSQIGKIENIINQRNYLITILQVFTKALDNQNQKQLIRLFDQLPNSIDNTDQRVQAIIFWRYNELKKDLYSYIDNLTDNRSNTKPSIIKINNNINLLKQDILYLLNSNKSQYNKLAEENSGFKTALDYYFDIELICFLIIFITAYYLINNIKRQSQSRIELDSITLDKYDLISNFDNSRIKLNVNFNNIESINYLIDIEHTNSKLNYHNNILRKELDYLSASLNTNFKPNINKITSIYNATKTVHQLSNKIVTLSKKLVHTISTISPESTKLKKPFKSSKSVFDEEVAD